MKWTITNGLIINTNSNYCFWWKKTTQLFFFSLWEKDYFSYLLWLIYWVFDFVVYIAVWVIRSSFLMTGYSAAILLHNSFYGHQYESKYACLAITISINLFIKIFNFVFGSINYFSSIQGRNAFDLVSSIFWWYHVKFTVLLKYFHFFLNIN